MTRRKLLAAQTVSEGNGVSDGRRTLETMHTMKPFSSMLYDSTVFASCRILPKPGVSRRVEMGGLWHGRTGVDELLLGNFPAFLLLDLRLQLANLHDVSKGCQ